MSKISEKEIVEGKGSSTEAIKARADFMLEQAKKFKDQYSEEKDEASRFYRADQWRFFKRRPFKNIIFSIIETAVPILNDSQAGVDVVPFDEENEEQKAGAEMLDAAIKWVLDYNSWGMRRAQLVRNTLIRGDSWVYTSWDEDVSNGEGEVVLRSIPDQFVFLDPMASLPEDANYLGLIVPMRKQELDRRFGAKAKNIEPGGGSKYSDIIDDIISGKYFEQRWSPGNTSSDQPYVKKYDPKDTVYVEEHWLKDYSLENIPQEETDQEIEKERLQIENGENPDVFKWEDHATHLGYHNAQFEELNAKKNELVSQYFDVPPELLTEADFQNIYTDPEAGQALQLIELSIQIIQDHIAMHEVLLKENPKSKRPKYKNGWRLLVKVDDDVLYDGPPDIDDGLLPIAGLYCYKEDDSWVGFGEARNLIPSQRVLNEMDWLELQGLRLNANSGWKFDKASGLTASNFNNEQGILLEVETGGMVERLPPNQISPQFSVRKNEELAISQFISGINDQTAGEAPNKVMAKESIARLFNNAIGRLREKSRYMDEFHKRIGMKIASIVIQKWSAERMLRVNDKLGILASVKYRPDVVRNLRYEIRVAPGTTAIGSKADQALIFKELALEGFIDQKQFFQLTDFPKRNIILDQIEERDQTQAMMQQLMAENEQLKAIIEQSGLGEEDEDRVKSIVSG